MFDQQRIHFAKLQNEQAENYFQNLKDVTKATMETNIIQQNEKMDRENKLKSDEQALDRHELDTAFATRTQYV